MRSMLKGLIGAGLLFGAGTVWAQTVTVTSPANGSTYQPGQSLTVAVTVSGEVRPGALLLSNFEGLKWYRWAAGPYSETFTVPADARPGKYYVLASVSDGTGTGTKESSRVDFNIEASGAVTALEAKPAGFSFEYAGQSERLAVEGLFGAEVVNLTEAPTLVVTSGNTAVARVEANRMVVAAGGGQTVLTVSYQGQELQVPVYVRSGIAGDLDGDGDVDSDDQAELRAGYDEQIIYAGDARDLDGNGVIDARDDRRMALLCTRTSCSNKNTSGPAPE